MDLSEIAYLGPKLGRYSAQMLCGPESSNQRILNLVSSAAAESGPEHARLLKDLRTKGGSPVPLSPSAALDIRQEAAGANGDGFHLKLSHTRQKNADRLHLAYALEVPPRLLLPADKPQTDEEGKRIFAILPVTLLAFDEKHNLNRSQTLGLPVVNTPEGTPERPVLSGSISLALGKFLGATLAGKKFSVWALALDRSALAEIQMGQP